MTEIPATDCVSGIEPLEMDDGELFESAILIVKTSTGNGEGAITYAATPGMSHWECLGMLHDTMSRLTGNRDD